MSTVKVLYESPPAYNLLVPTIGGHLKANQEQSNDPLFYIILILPLTLGEQSIYYTASFRIFGLMIRINLILLRLCWSRETGYALLLIAGIGRKRESFIILLFLMRKLSNDSLVMGM